MNIFRRLTPPLVTIAEGWTGAYDVEGDARAADCVVGFSFGYRQEGKIISPGLSNQDIANLILRQYVGKPLILQFEIADAYEAAGGDTTHVTRIEHHRVKGEYLDTREVALQAADIMKRHAFSTAALIAHPFHMPRIQAVCSQVGIQWACDSGLRGAIEFDPLSAQRWTRTIDDWRGYEPLAISYYRLKGWL